MPVMIPRPIFACNTADIVMAANKKGKAIKISTIRISTSSVHPP